MDNEVGEDDVDKTVTIDEFLEDVEAQELEADLILGGDQGKECTYSKGYVKRQALFSCLTCTPEGNAGVCTACSLACHDGHEVVELWTKRDFRCDCGNSKFGVAICKLTADKEPENIDNTYNQNFKGIYCTCCLPYPDPNAEEQVEMIQCCACEDWFHENHLGLDFSEQIPVDEDGEPLYEDFICLRCSPLCSFLSLYPPFIWAKDRNTQTGLLENESALPSSTLVQGDSCISEVIPQQNETAPMGNKSDNGPSLTIEGTSSGDTSSNGSCILGLDLAMKVVDSSEKKPLFLSKGWRDKLCRCESCVTFYSQKSISYLIDKEDSLEEYERMAKRKRDELLEEQAGAAANLIDNLGHVAKIEFLNGVADMESEIRSFLGSHDTSNPITPADIRQMFENLARKRQRTE